MNRHIRTETRFKTLSSALKAVSLVLVFVFFAGCSPGRESYDLGLQAERSRNFDEALIHYQAALNAKPGDNGYLLKVEQARFNAAFQHFEEGRRALERGEFDLARAEFMRARELDPTHDLARTELARVEELLLTGAPQEPQTRSDFETRSEEARVDPSPDLVLSPTVVGPIDLRMTQDAQAVFETIGALTGVNVLFDSNFATNPPTLDVTIDNMTVYEAFDLVALLSNAFWVPVSQNTIMVAPNNTQARASYEPQILKTIYLENSINPADITEIMAALRQLLQLTSIAQMTSMNAIMIRDTPDKVAIAEKIIADFDKAKPEVLVEARVLEVDRNRLRELGILPGQGTSVGLDPAVISTAPFVNLRDLDGLNSGSFNLVIPDTLVEFLENDSQTRLVQNPSVRSSDGVLATIRIGSRVPVASGSFQPAFVGATGTPVVQFQYIDVGVNMDITPRVLRNREVSMQVVVQVAGTAGTSDLGGLTLPIFSNREIRHEIRLQEGETNVLGGLISNSETTAVSGLPGLSKIPVLGRLFSSETVSGDQTEIIVLLTPHIVKMPNLSDYNLRGIMVGTQNDTRLRGLPIPPEEGPAALPEAASLQADALALAEPPVEILEAVPSAAAAVEVAPPTPPLIPATDEPVSATALGDEAAPLTAPVGGPASLTRGAAAALTPAGAASLPAGPGIESELAQIESDTGNGRLNVRVSGENMIGADVTIEFDPATVLVENVTDGGLLSSDGTAVALVQSIDRERGIARISLDRPANAPSISGEGAILELQVEGARDRSAIRVSELRIRTGSASPGVVETARRIITNQ